MGDYLWLAGLAVIMGMVLLLPFSVRKVEEELEIFLLVMGSLAVTVSRLWDLHLIHEALYEPIKISVAVLVFGLVFRQLGNSIRHSVSRVAHRMGMRTFLFVFVVGLGFLSSIITAIIAALVLVEVISGLKLSKDRERAVAVLACYSIGLGAVLTPVGEPLSTIVNAKLAGPPHNADFFFLAREFFFWVTPGILASGLLATRYAGRDVAAGSSLVASERESYRTIFLRTGKVYAFVAALVLLGRGFMPVVDRYIIGLPNAVLYWVNMVSAVLDNATLAAAEVSPRMSEASLRCVLLGLLISGGMLIPGNIPNIISAKQLGIGSRDWAKVGVPVGLGLMAAYAVVLMFVSP
ncbi:MAG: hypothetical protein A2X36_05335 [Elusimicrobia bacterium GWA2_69_24]|nr:MAG: hypothetical protein A2X36_05335 [Elusimicrobia bacterium GWA2_69_24]HBL18748.1 cation transporter [Elusimicrobiota bacterium]